jgi:hypothetical protein
MLTKQAHFVPTNKTITAEDFASLFLHHVYRLHGLPSLLVSDRDPRFTSDFWQSLMRPLGTRLNISTAYHPQTDGQTERTNRTLEQILRAYVHPFHDNWSTLLPLVEFAYNNAEHASTTTTPFFANYGFHPSTPATVSLPNHPPAADYLRNLQDVITFIKNQLELAKRQQEEQTNRHRRDLTFAIGDQVKLDTSDLRLFNQPSKKLRERYIGPFKIAAVISPVAYKLHLPPSMSKVHPVFHVSKLLPWRIDYEFPDHPTPDHPTPSASDAPPTGEFYLDYILDVKCDIYADTGKPELLFRVRWSEPYNSPEHDTWEPYRHVKGRDALTAFLTTPVWQAFKISQQYKDFLKAHPRTVPNTPAWR